ncbi:MAG: cohesin domain-containing protein [Terriglobia bacterium]
MRRLFSASLFLVLLMALSPLPAQADSFIVLSPGTITIPEGVSFSMELSISGLGLFMAPSLGAWDLDVLFDSSILGFTGATFGDPILGDQLDLFGLGSITGVDNSLPGVLNLFQLSLDFPIDLDTLQADSFVLATLDFDAIGVGSSALTINLNALSDADGFPLVAGAGGANATVTPEPATLLLLASGLGALGAWRRKRKLR